MNATLSIVAGLAEQAEAAIRDYDRASETVSECADVLLSLQQERARRKTEALVRLCAEPHPVTGKTYTPSQAEDVLQLDPEYAAYKNRVAEAEAALREALDVQTSALRVVDLRIAQVKAESGVR